QAFLQSVDFLIGQRIIHGNGYSTHYLDEHHPAHEQSEVDDAGTLTERVFKSKEMLLIFAMAAQHDADCVDIEIVVDLF
ncbi:hypothetical protein, partial [Salmonella enterica]|uniref:hypothetical protein n=1 Tax=Salmonella enterica TaxID=28901 RepID=UPI0020C254AA